MKRTATKLKSIANGKGLSLVQRGIAALTRAGATVIWPETGYPGIYQDSAGVTPVTALADLIGLVLDRTPNENGVAVARYGPELFGAANWLSNTAPTFDTASGGTFSNSTDKVSVGYDNTTISVVANNSYQITVPFTLASGSVAFSLRAGSALGTARASSANYTASGTWSTIFVATATEALTLRVSSNTGSGATSVTVTGRSAKQVRGNHATQSAVASKPSVQRVPKRLGPNLVVNGTFNTDTGWTKGEGWTISGGKAVRSPSSFGSVLSQPISVTAGKSYVVTYTLADRVAGGPNVAFSGGTAVNGPSRTVNGTYSDTLLALPGNNTLWIVTGDNTSSLSFDNISAQEVLEWANVISFDGSNDFLQTGITTGNEGWVCAGVTPANTTTAMSVFNAGEGTASITGVWLFSSNGTWYASAADGTLRSQALLAMQGTTPQVVSIGWDASSIFVGVNGTESATTLRTGNCSSGANTARIGMYQGSSTPFNGPMTCIAICPTLPPAADRALIRKFIGWLQAQTL